MLKNNLVLRSITGLLFVAAVIASILIHSLTFGALFFVFTMIGTQELLKASREVKGVSVNSFFVYFSSGVSFLLLLSAATIGNYQILYFLVLLLPLSMLLELYRKKDFPFTNIAYSLLPTLYIGIPMGLLNLIRVVENGNVLLAFFVTIWAGDTFAYSVGSLIGKHRLFERISPKKSWEGTLGSMLLTLGLAFFFPQLFGVLSLWQWLAFVLISLVFGSYGDLVESLFKRSVSIKDSGSILPGHGGVLDRFDAVFLASPFIFVFLQIINTVK